MSDLEQSIENALFFFRSLPNEENTSGEKNGDVLFQRYGIGNDTYNINQPYERLNYYEKLLLALKSDKPLKYDNIHKGTAFFFMAWLAFDIRNYDKAMYYADAAIAEDMKHWLHWRCSSAIRFYTLEPWPENKQLERTIPKITEVIDEQLNRFSKLPGIPKQLSKTIFLSGFIESLLTSGDIVKRSIISAFYVFILKFDDLYTMLRIRTAHGGSILPFVAHLFTGGLLFESILKIIYPSKEKLVLNKITTSKEFKSDFGAGEIKESSLSLTSIVSSINDKDPIYPTSFSITSKIRNTTGHNIIWDDIFIEPDNFRKLFEQEVNAILYVIAKKY